MTQSMQALHDTAYPRLQMFIGDIWTDGDGGDGEAVINPATGTELAWLPHASERDLERALAAAERSFPAWAATPAIERRNLLLAAARLLRERSVAIAHTLTLEEGKPLSEALGEVNASIDIFEWYAEEARRLYGRTIPARGGDTAQSVRLEPVGPVAAFTPWNFPALTPARKIAGALAAGCSLIIKPSEETPGTAVELVRACVDAGIPAGVLNLVFGVPSQVSEYLIRSPIIRKITFTGSIPVGKHLAQLAAEHGLKRCTLELGGHAPVIVCDDADIAQAAKVCAAGRFRNAGQVCVAPSRFYVQRQVADDFVAALSEAAAGLTLGNGLNQATTMGPLANARRLAAMSRYVDDAARCGGTIATGGKALEGPGFFFTPTVLTGLPDSALAMREETFGPIAPVTTFEHVDEALRRANSLPYGLAAYGFTRSARTAALLSQHLAAGMVGINHFAISLAEAPFGGVNESGYGSEGGTEGLSAYLSTKFVSHLLM